MSKLMDDADCMPLQPESPVDQPSLTPSLTSYLQHGMDQVAGWLGPTTAAIIAALLMEQTLDGHTGDVCEIGVHHGKLFLLLANGITGSEQAVAVDVFGDQEKNVDASGCGDRDVFESNVGLYAPGCAINVIQDSSLDLEQKGFCENRFRFFSVDGGHTPEATINDLRLAEQTLLPAGIVALDDVLNPSWTGVLTGLVAYQAAGGALVPFALVPNKLLLTTDTESALHYGSFLQHQFRLACEKRSQTFLGGSVDIYHEHPHYNYGFLAGLQRKIAAMTEACRRQVSQLADIEQKYAAQSEEIGRMIEERKWLRSVVATLEADKADLVTQLEKTTRDWTEANAYCEILTRDLQKIS
jgi:hypothetical protein